MCNNEAVFAFLRLCRAAGCASLCALCLQEGQQSGERGDQSLPGEQEDLSGSGGTSYRLVADTLARISRFLPLAAPHFHIGV